MNNKSYLKIKVKNISLLNFINYQEGGAPKSDYGYKKMKNIDLNKYTFINFSDKEFKFEDVKYFKGYNSILSWKDILCDEKSLDIFTIKTNCKNPVTGKNYQNKDNLSIYKVFVKGYNNLGDYIKSIQSGKISKVNHIKLFSKIFKIKSDLELILGKKIKLINHNLDVNILHFKFRMK